MIAIDTAFKMQIQRAVIQIHRSHGSDLVIANEGFGVHKPGRVLEDLNAALQKLGIVGSGQCVYAALVPDGRGDQPHVHPTLGGKGQRPEGMEMPEGFEGFGKDRPEGMGRGEMPEGFQPGQMPEGMEMPEGFEPGQMPSGFGGRGEQSGEANTEFYMNDKVNAFSGVKAAV